MVERGDSDFTAATVPGPVESLISAAAMERLRDQARQEQAPMTCCANQTSTCWPLWRCYETASSPRRAC
jgi:hypothetical protein